MAPSTVCTAMLGCISVVLWICCMVETPAQHKQRLKLLCLALQECVYHKAVMDKKSPATLARLAKQAAVMYGEVSSIFNQPALLQHFERSWVAHTQMKVGRGSCAGGCMCTEERMRSNSWLLGRTSPGLRAILLDINGSAAHVPMASRQGATT